MIKAAVKTSKATNSNQKADFTVASRLAFCVIRMIHKGPDSHYVVLKSMCRELDWLMQCNYLFCSVQSTGSRLNFYGSKNSRNINTSCYRDVCPSSSRMPFVDVCPSYESCRKIQKTKESNPESLYFGSFCATLTTLTT